MILLDTDHLSILVNTRASAHGTLLQRLDSARSEVLCVPIVAAEEQCRGWLSQIGRQRDLYKQVAAYQSFAQLLEFLANWEIAQFDIRAADEFKILRKQLRRLGSQDLKFASIALANEALLLSANLRDFQQVPGLRVENWLS